MSEFYCEVVRVGEIEKHPHADNLSLTTVLGYPVIIRTGEFNSGDLAVYIPVDAIVPDTAQWSFLKGHRRIRAKRLRGIYSQGMLAPLPAPTRHCDEDTEGNLITAKNASPWAEKDNMIEAMGITKWEPDVDYKFGGDGEHFPYFAPVYDIEGLPRYKRLLKEGTEVSITEKLHGCNARYTFRDERIWCGSRNHFRKDDANCLWWCVARKYNLEEKLKQHSEFILYGEVFGQVQDLKYGAGKNDLYFRAFDIFDTTKNAYLDYYDFLKVCKNLDIDVVPSLYVGPWNSELTSLCEGTSTLAEHVREGFVVRPTKEIIDPHFGRLIFKQVGQGYHLRK